MAALQKGDTVTAIFHPDRIAHLKGIPDQIGIERGFERYLSGGTTSVNVRGFRFDLPIETAHQVGGAYVAGVQLVRYAIADRDVFGNLQIVRVP